MQEIDSMPQTEETPTISLDADTAVEVLEKATRMIGSKVPIEDRQVAANTFIREQVAELLENHLEDIATLLSEAHKVGIGFQAIINFNDIPNTVQTTMSFSRIVKDRRMAQIGDPNQEELPFGTTANDGPSEQPASEEAPKKRGRGRPRKVRPIEEQTPHIVAGVPEQDEQDEP